MTPIFSGLLRTCRSWQRLFALSASLTITLLTTACAGGVVHSVISPKSEQPQPDQQIDDYLTVGCTEIWQLAGNAVESNPLYWLRGMDCARQLTPAEARVIAHRHEDATWQSAFRRGILLADARITPTERKGFMDILSATQGRIPGPVQPLYRVWISGQQLQIKLFAERGRYNKLRLTTDAEMDTLRQQQQHLHSQLELTTRKLENLTDIERQLSTRKPSGSYAPDSGHRASAGDDVSNTVTGGDTDTAAGKEKP